MGLERPRGTRDFKPDEAWERDSIEGKVRAVFESFGYGRIDTPLFEYAELFELKSGEEISEHMYVFSDKSGRRLCLRPEATASVCRMYASELKNTRKPLRLYYVGRMYRYERPQRGRYREFWQAGLESIGVKSAAADAEVIEAAVRVLNAVGLSFSLDVGHLGVVRSLLSGMDFDEKKQDHIISLVDRGMLDDVRKIVSDKRLFSLMELKGGEAVLSKAGKILSGCEGALSALKELAEISGILKGIGVPHTLNLGMGRGLSYYTGVVFEIRVPGLGAENQVCGGGRYDRLIELFGGGSTPAVGFAFGFDRLVEAAKGQGVEFEKPKPPVVVAALSESAVGKAMEAASLLRKSGIRAEFDVEGRKLGRILSEASDDGVEWAVIAGEREIAEGSVAVKNLRTQKQETVKVGKLVETLS
jgi:histidyl-tRNA synthetase